MTDNVARGSGEMDAQTLGYYLRRIWLARSVPALHALLREVVDLFPHDEATPRLSGVIAVKAKRLVRGN